MREVEEAMTHTDKSPAQAVAAHQRPRRRILTILWLALGLMALAPASSLGLPEGRHYEMVSPPYKGGYGVSGLPTTIEAVAPDGESVAFGSIGVFAGAPSNHLFNAYLARRDPISGWHSVSLDTPASSWPYAFNGVLDFSSTLGSSLTFGKPGPNRGWAESFGTENEFLLHAAGAPDTPEGFEVAGGVLTAQPRYDPAYAGASADLSHLVVFTETTFGSHALYDLVSRGGGENPLRLIGLNNNPTPKPIDPSCGLQLGSGLAGKLSKVGAINADGSEIFFTTCAGAPSSQQVFVRLDGARTLEVSRPLEAGPFGGCGDGGKAGEVPGEVPCPGAATRASAEFVGASNDGSRVFFATTASLSAEDKDTRNDLYMATIGCPAVEPECPPSRREVTSLAQVSHDPNPGEAAEVQGVVAVSPDGSHIYFVTRGVLSEGPNAEAHAPVKGADNLYVYERDARYPAGHVAFVADLCSGPVSTGVVTDGHCPSDLFGAGSTFVLNDSGLWASFRPEAQTTGTGGFLVFSSYGQLLPNDTDNTRDIYRYDAETGALDRVSVGEAGYDANGNCDNTAEEVHLHPEELKCDATFGVLGGVSDSLVVDRAELRSRAVSEDGSRIVFTTTEPLSPAAVNGVENAYEWHKQPGWSEGRVSLVSMGSDEQRVDDVVITPDGRDVFFATVQGLLPQDTDGLADVYDARLGGSGFPVPPAARQPCSGDACQGPLTNPASLLVPGSVSQAPGENLASPKKAMPKKKVKKKAKAKKRRKGRAARVSHTRHSARAASGRGRR